MATTTTVRTKSYQATKNEGNNLFFLILHNILTDKDETKYRKHIDNETFNDVYNTVSVEKALSKCYDFKVVQAIIEHQLEFTDITDKKAHYYYMLGMIPKTYKQINWKQDTI